MEKKNYTIHVKPVENDPDYLKSLDLMKDKGFCIATVVRSLIKEFAKKIEVSGF